MPVRSTVAYVVVIGLSSLLIALVLHIYVFIRSFDRDSLIEYSKVRLERMGPIVVIAFSLLPYFLMIYSNFCLYLFYFLLEINLVLYG